MKKKLFSMLLLGACFLASMSLFTSCKDYDDDIKSNKAEIVALRSELLTVKTNLEQSLNTEKSAYETQIAALKAQLESAISNKADQSTVDELKTKLDSMEKDYAARMAVLTSQIEAAYDAIGRIDQKADQSTVDGVIADLAALTGQLKDEAKAREAVEANLRIQMEALQKFMDEFNDANLQEQIDQLKAAIGEIQTNQEISVMRSQMTNLEQMIVNVNANLSALEVLVERMLNSISLVPQLFIKGIEAIEFTSLKYNAFMPNDTVPTGASYLVSTGETEATYRLNPTTVQESGIDVANINFLAATADTRAVEVESPIAFNGIKDFHNGLMTVKIKKVKNVYLGDDDVNPITIVALKVPRNPNLYEPADIISENSRLVENFYFPRIAARAQENNANFVALINRDWSGQETFYDNVDNPSGRLVDLYRPRHFSDSLTVLNSRVDDNPLKLVSKLVYYRETYDLKKLITGCKYNGSYRDPACVCETTITPAQLKQYGMAFRFHMMNRDYFNDAPHRTNQQEFATVTPDGIIKSCIPNGVTDNKACIGKEPIVRVELVDTVQGHVVDRRYLKIKWTDKKDPGPDPQPELADTLLFEKESSATLDPCGGASATPITWREFITQVYAAIEHHSALAGISEQMFREIYMTETSKPILVSGSWKTNWPSNYASLTSAPNHLDRITDPLALPVVSETTNLHGDAIIASWDLTPSQIKTIYCNSENDTKTFTAKVLFQSNDPRYPNVYFNWKFTISLPKPLPSITAFYDQYWLSNAHQEHDILPLQFKSELQEWWAAHGKNYCFYDNDLMNVFKYENNRIVKNIPSPCGSWDIQFEQNYGTLTTSDIYDTGNGSRISLSGGKHVDTRYFYNSELPLSLINWQNFAGYKRGLLTMTWWQDNYAANGNYNLHDVASTHKAWDNSAKNTYARLDRATLSAADITAVNSAYLNALDNNPANDIIGPDGTRQPLRTHTKPVGINVWGALNPWNYIPVWSYKAYLVAPLRVNMHIETEANWQDGEVSGCPRQWRSFFTLTDFRGYLVKNVPDGSVSSTDEQLMWTQSLWDYYQVQDPVFACDDAKFSFKEDANGNIVIDNNIDPAVGGMTSGQLRLKTNGNIAISFKQVGNYIYFYNNGGSNVEARVRVAIPVTVSYGWGSISTWVYGWVYPHGELPGQ